MKWNATNMYVYHDFMMFVVVIKNKQIKQNRRILKFN